MLPARRAACETCCRKRLTAALRPQSGRALSQHTESVVFLYTNNETPEKEIKKTIPFKAVSKQ